MNIKKLFRTLVNFLVPTPATVRRHRAPSARFATLAALAASHGDTLTRDGRSYTLATADLRMLEFENLAQVKAFMSLANPPINEADRADGGPYPGDADYVERPRNMFKIGALSPAVAQGDTYDIGSGPRRSYGIETDGKTVEYTTHPAKRTVSGPRRVFFKTGTYTIGPDGKMIPVFDEPQKAYTISPNEFIGAGPATDVGSAKPFVPVVATPITNDIVRE